MKIKQKRRLYIRKNVQYSPSGITIFINIHNAIYNKLYEDVKRVVETKVSFKIQTVCQFSFEDGNNGKDNEKYNIEKGLVHIDDYDNEDILTTRSFVSSKSVESSRDSLDDTLQSQKVEVHEQILNKLDSHSINRIEKTIIVVYQAKKVEVRHIFQHRRHITIQDAD